MFRDGAYQLNPDLSYSIDCEEFERCVVDAENAKRDKDNASLRANLERARELYRGEFMSGVYEDWAEERRTYYEEQHMRVLAAAARLDFSEKKWTGALKIANEILSSDPYREDMHRLIMKIYAVQGKAAALKEQYESLRAMLQKDLGIQPANETRRVYAELIK